MAAYRMAYRFAVCGAALLALGACDDFDLDLRNNGANTSDAARQTTAPRPAADARGVISYPGYQVAVAQRGDSVANVAVRVGLDPAALAAHNGLLPDTELREGEILALPTRVDDSVDISTLASDAINRADAGAPTTADGTITAASSAQPIRHQVLRGETAYSIARLYNVSVNSLSEWNGLGPNLEVREGQYLLIPVAAAAQPAVTTTPLPGEGSQVETPPSAAAPLPDEPETITAEVTSPDMAQDRTSKARLALPVQGSVIREYEKNKNEGIDIAAAAGAPVTAAADGTVAAITRDTDQVPILVLRHSDSLLTVYANIDGIAVEKGDTVKRGQKIAAVRGGSSSFLHFEVREGVESVDPLPYLN